MKKNNFFVFCCFFVIFLLAITSVIILVQKIHTISNLMGIVGVQIDSTWALNFFFIFYCLNIFYLTNWALLLLVISSILLFHYHCFAPLFLSHVFLLSLIHTFETNIKNKIFWVYSVCISDFIARSIFIIYYQQNLFNISDISKNSIYFLLEYFSPFFIHHFKYINNLIINEKLTTMLLSNNRNTNRLYPSLRVKLPVGYLFCPIIAIILSIIFFYLKKIQFFFISTYFIFVSLTPFIYIGIEYLYALKLLLFIIGINFIRLLLPIIYIEKFFAFLHGNYFSSFFALVIGLMHYILPI